MVYVFVNSSIKIKINQFEPIYNLKEYIQNETNIPIHKQILYYNGFKLHNNKSILDYNINNWSNIELTTELKGGFDTLSALMWLLYICGFLLYLLLMISGLMPIIARAYSYLVDWSLKKLGELIGIGNNKYYQSFVFIITFLVSLFIVYYFVYATTAFTTFPLVYTRTDNVCKSIQTSNDVGWWVAIFFIIFYGILNIPNIFTNIIEDATKINVAFEAILNPFISTFRNFANEGKFAPFYAIPFVGTPFLSGYGMAIDISSQAVVDGLGFASKYNCKENSTELANLLMGKTRSIGGAEWGSIIRNIVREYNAEELVKMISIGLDEKKLEDYKCHVDNMPFWQKFGKISTEYYMSKTTAQGFCFGLRFINAIDKFLKSIGGSDQIANIIKTGNLSGMVSLIVFIICIILAMLNII